MRRRRGSAGTAPRRRRSRSRGPGAHAGCRPGPSRAAPYDGSFRPVRCTGAPSTSQTNSRPARSRRSTSSRVTASRLVPGAAAGLLVGVGVERPEPRQRQVRRPPPWPTRSGPGRRRGVRTRSPSSKSRVCSAPTTSPPASRAVSSANVRTAGSAPFDAADRLAAVVQQPGQPQRGLLRHRQHEQRVRRERRRPHGHARDAAVRRPRDGVPVRQSGVPSCARDVPRARRHRRDDGGEHRVEGEVRRPRVQERGRVVDAARQSWSSAQARSSRRCGGSRFPAVRRRARRIPPMTPSHSPQTCPRRRAGRAAPSSYRTSLRWRGSRRPGRSGGRTTTPTRFDRTQDPRAGLLDRHPAPDGLGAAARRARLLLHAHRPDRALPADARASRSSTRWAGTTTACRPSAGCRTTSACAATRRCPTTPTSRRRRSRTRSGRSRSAGRTSSSCASGSSRRTRRSSSRCGARSASRSTGSSTTRRSARSRRPVSQRAFLRNFARGEAYLQEAPTLWDVTFQTAVAQAELEAREYAGAYHRVAFHRRRTAARSTSRPPAPS